jgi:ATP-binding cassette subfamily C protein CydD
VIADPAGEVLRTITTLPPRQLAAHRDSAAALITRGLDGLRPYFTAYLPSLSLAGILTPAVIVAIFLYDGYSAVIVLIALPLIPIFMVDIRLLTRERSAASLAAMTTLQSRLLDPVAGIPTLRALGRIGNSAQRIAELGAAHRRSAMATLLIAFLSELVLALLATLEVALVAVGSGCAWSTARYRCQAASPPCCWRRRCSGRCAGLGWNFTPRRTERPPPTTLSACSIRWLQPPPDRVS